MTEREKPDLDAVRDAMREHDENAETGDPEPEDAAREPGDEEQDSEDEG
jgi:hypothetical protein